MNKSTTSASAATTEEERIAAVIKERAKASAKRKQEEKKRREAEERKPDDTKRVFGTKSQRQLCNKIWNEKSLSQTNIAFLFKAKQPATDQIHTENKINK